MKKARLLLPLLLLFPFFNFSQTYTINMGGSVSTCGGTFYDSGGSGGSYSNNETYTMTFCSSTPGDNISFTFSSYDAEAFYDYLYIYDGPSSSSTLIGSYSYTNPGTVTSTNGCLTFVFDSDGSNTNTGWAATITCVTPPPPPAPTVQDCEGAIPVCTSSYSETNAYSGTGNFPDEIDSGPSCLGSGEKNDVWYTFTVINSGDLCFTITPNVSSDDYDWAVYDLTTANCADIYSNSALEVSCNYSGTSGNTGPSGNAGVQNEPCVSVTVGETYVVNVSQFSTSTNGYTLDFGASSASIFDNVPPEIQSVDQPISCGSTSLSFHFSESILCSTISDGDFQLTGPGGPYTLSGVSGPNCISGGTQENDFTINVSPPLTTSGNFQLCLTNSAGSVTDLCGNVAPPSCLNFTINNGVVANAGSDQTICSGGTPANLSGSGSGGTTPYTYSWSPTTALSNANASSTTASPTSTTTYTLTVSDAAGCQAVDDVTITVTPPPVVTVNSPSICYGGNATLTAAGATTYTWSPSTGLSGTTGSTVTASPTSTSNYTVTGNTPGCPAVTATSTVTVLPQIVPNFTINGTFCQQSNSVNFTETSTGESASATYTWAFTGATTPTGTGATVNNVTWSTAGTYNVTLTVTDGPCSQTITLPITINPQPTVTASGTDPLCNGTTDGTITATGSTTGSYSWNPANSGAGPHSVGAGIYTVTFTDGNGCIASDQVTLTDPATLAVTSTSTNASCFGTCDGTATANTSTGGTSPYTYSWSGGLGNTQNATAACAGSYTVTVTDAHNCTATSSVTITEPTQLSISATPTNVTCNGACDGSIATTTSGGTSPFTYSWTNGLTGSNPTGVCANSYTVTVTDANGCSANASVSVTEPLVITVTTTDNDASCNGVCDGSVSANATGGTGAITYSWSAPLTTGASQSNVCAGTFTVTATDGNGCTQTATATVNEPAVLDVTITGNDVTCNGTCDGDATATVTGGTTPYSYQWDASGNLATTSAVTSLCAGTPNLTVTDGNGCTETGSITINEPSSIDLTPSATNSTCGNSNGSVSVIASGGAGGYTYSWSDGAIIVGTSSSTGTLPAGTYTVTVTDANGCTNTASATISDTGGGTAAATLDNDASCNGICDGGATASMTGGTAPFTYLWNNGETTAAATALCVGTASVDITDANGCISSATVTIAQPTILSAAVTTSSNPTCNGTCDGTATITVSGGTSPYLYSWDNSTSTTNSATDLCVGTHIISITDANGCTTTATTTLTEPTPLTANINGVDPLCTGASSGSADLTASGGTAPYTFSWDDAGNSSSEDISNLPAATYTVTVTDANNCTTTANVTLSDPTPITLTPSSTDANCSQADGEVCVSANGGAGTYTYSWDDASSQTTACASNVLAGTYNVTVTDANNCTETTSVTIVSQPGPTTTASLVTDASGSGLCDGELTTTTSGGTTPYSYSWDDPGTQTTQNASNLCAGTYCVTVTDVNNCTTTSCATVNEPNAIVITIVPVNILCSGNCTGEADATISGGVPPYTYSWSSGAAAQDLTGLCAGNYTITVIDANGVSGSQSVTITEPTPIVISTISGTNNSCFNACDGTVTASATGGSGTLTYSWDNGLGNGASISNVCAGTYTVTVTDTNSCTQTANTTITEPTLLTVSTSTTDANCGQADGEACATITGGTTPYTQSWDDPSTQTSLCASSIPSGTYTVSVTDANGCIASATATINDISGGTASIVIDNNTSCNGACDGIATASMTGGGVGPFTYSWNSGNSPTTASNSGLCAGPISVTITDANNCNSTANATVTEPAVLSLTTTGTDVTCFAGTDGGVLVTATGGTITSDYTYSWVNQSNNVNVGTTQSITGLSAGTYCVTVTDDNGCSGNACVTITEPTQIIVTTSTINANCGQADGAVSVATTTGGSGSYNSESWTDASNTPVTLINSVAAGTYTVVVTDNVGCTGTATASVSDLAGPTVTLTSQTDALCNGSCDGTADVSVSGGVSPYTYNWTPNPGAGQGTASLTNLCAGNYSLALIDVNGCTASISVAIGEPAVVVNNVTSNVDALGNGTCDGTASVQAVGGDGSFTYTWYNDCAATTPNGSLTGSQATGLCANSYGVIATDGNGCADTACVVINEPTPITTTLTGTETSCFGVCDGTATVTASGGVGGYTYEWFSSPSNTSTNQTTATASNLCAGDYYVVVIDANGIVHTSALYTVTEPTQLSGNINIISNYNGYDVSCEYNCDGSTEAIPTGGTAPYSFVWTDPSSQTSQIATNLCTGPLDVVITDANGCTITLNTSLSKPPFLGGTLASTDANCYGSCDGDATISAAGGVQPYSYQWNDPALTTTNSVSNLCAGTYTATITDDNGCTFIDSVNITQPVQLVLNSSMTGSNCDQYDGSATVTIVSGVAPFTYQWDAAAANQTTATATNLIAGCYNVTVTDANGCTEIENVCVIDLGAPSATLLTQYDVSCNSACDGFAQIAISGGTPPLNYNWYDSNNTAIGQPTASATGLCAGTYTGEMIDSVGCQATVSVTITEPTALNAVISSSIDVTCFNYCDGSATVLASGGTAPYTYMWNDASNQTTAQASNLCPGTYIVTVFDANSCSIDVSVTINEPLQIQLNTTAIDAFCDTPSGSASVITTNGVAPFTYAWDDANTQVTATAINLIPGLYNVTATDADGCFVSTTATVGNIPPSNAVISNSTDVLCFGGSDGTATISISGTGTPPYTIEWYDASGTSYGQDTITATGLAPGQYYVQLTDVNGCTTLSDTTIIAEPSDIVLNSTSAMTNCFGSCDGESQAFVNGGTAPYGYQWNDPLLQTTNLAQNLCSGTYTITVTDANGCQKVDSTTVLDPAPLVLDSTVTNAHCGLPDGQACVITSGGTAPYTYSWLSGNTNSCQTGLTASTYCVTVTDANQCSDIICIEVQDLNGPSAEITDSSFVTCNGGNNGSATVNMTGGYGFFTVQWDASAGNQTTPTASNLSAGAYSVTITDSVGCIASASVYITEPSAIVSIPSSNDANCFGSCDGEAWVNSVGGTPPYSYSWTDVNNSVIGFNDSISGLCNGTYVLSLLDANNCAQILNYTINQPLQVTGTASSTDVTCNGACDGTATASGVIGVQPFSYQWDAAAGNQTTAQATNLCPGTYTCTVTDANGCTTTVSTSITEPTLLTAAINSSGDVSCFAYSDGWAQVDATGGTPNYTYSWNTFSTQQTASNLISGNYSVTVTDANGCTATASTYIDQPTPLAASTIISDVDCYGNCNGTATVNVSGGIGGFSYQWDDPNFSSTSTVGSLCNGSYSVLITDLNGCQLSKNVTINQPTPIGMSVTINNSNCGQNNGQACVNVYGGTTPYVYQWNDPLTQTSACLQDVLANCYQVTILDGNGCSADSLICITDVAGPVVTYTGSTDVTCNGLQNGTVNMTVSGGTGGTTLTWYDNTGTVIPSGSGQTSLQNLNGGCYTLQVTDGANCVASDVGCVFEPSPINSSIFISNDATCNNGCNGEATVSVNGGLVANDYSYSWNDPSSQSTQQATGLCAGTYTVTVADDNNCSTQSSITINEPLPLAITITNVTNASCFGSSDGSISITTSGGTPPYLYNWVQTGTTSTTANNLSSGTYTIIVTDANGCSTQLNIDITEPTVLSVTSSTTHSTCTSCNGTGTIIPSGGTAPYSYNWYGVGNNPASAINNGLCPGAFQVQVTDANGCSTAVNDAIIDEPSPIVDSIVVSSPLCNGTNTGSATVYVSGGTGSYTYNWNDPASQTAQTAVAISAGNFCVQVADANNCLASQCTTVTEPSQLNGVPDGDATICYGDSTQIWASGQGGIAPYTVNWSNPSLSGFGPIVVTPTVTSSYCFTITDANGCLSHEPECIDVTVTPPLNLTVTDDIFVCDGSDTTLTAIGSQGNGGPYTFTWSDENGNGLVGTPNGNSSTTSVSPSSQTYYYVTLTDGCTIPVSDSILVSISDNPQLLVIASDSSGCQPFNTEFVATSDIGTSFTFDVDCDGTPEAQGTANTFNYTYSNSGLFDVCVSTTSPDGCVSSVSIPEMIQVFQNPVANFTLDPTETSILSPTVTALDNSIGGNYYAWDFGDGFTISGPMDSVLTPDSLFAGTMTEISHFYSDTGYFDITLTITNLNGCTSTYTQTVHIVGDYILFAPSAITPNGDGKNDVFYPRGIGIDPDNYKLFVFNRWGELIFESYNPSVGWDGTYNDKLVQVDVYVWMVRTQDNKGTPHEYIGHVTVVR